MPYLGYDRGSHANNHHSRINFTASAEETKEAPEYGEDHFRGFNTTKNRQRQPYFITTTPKPTPSLWNVGLPVKGRK